MSHNIPLLASVRSILRVQKAMGADPEYITNYLGTVTTHHEFAAGFLALWIWTGQYPTLSNCNAFVMESVAIAEASYELVKELWDKKEEVAKVSRNYYEPIQHRLTATVQDNGGYVLGMSDAARAEAAAARRLEGKGEYKGQRFIKPRMKGSMNGIYGHGKKQNVIGW